MTTPLDTDVGLEVFTDYENDFKTLFTTITQRLDQINALAGEPRRAALSALEREVDEAKEVLGQMKMEVQNIPTASRVQINHNLRNYSTDLDKAEKTIKRLSDNADRHTLFGGRGSNNGTGDAVADQRQQLLAGTERLQRSSERLMNSRRLANETEETGTQILGTLASHREQLENTSRMLHTSEGYVDKSIKTLRGMARRMATNRIITIAIITVLILLILAVIASKFR